MRNFNEITFREFGETMNTLRDITTDNKKLYTEMMVDICKECRLAEEMFDYIIKMNKKGITDFSELATEHHKVILAIWLLLNDYNRSDTTLH